MTAYVVNSKELEIKLVELVMNFSTLTKYKVSKYQLYSIEYHKQLGKGVKNQYHLQQLQKPKR